MYAVLNHKGKIITIGNVQNDKFVFFTKEDAKLVCDMKNCVSEDCLACGQCNPVDKHIVVDTKYI